MLEMITGSSQNARGNPPPLSGTRRTQKASRQKNLIKKWKKFSLQLAVLRIPTLAITQKKHRSLSA